MSAAATTGRRDPCTLWLESCFLNYQLRWILDESDVALALKARQIGFSDATAARCVRKGLYDKRTQVLLSANQDLANEVLSKARAHCRFLAEVGEPWAVQFDKDNSEEIAWKTGGRILSLPANARTARSYAGDVYLDEAAYHQDLTGIVDAAFPMASRGNFQIRILSTPNGATGLFYEWADKLLRRSRGEAVDLGWSFHFVSIDDAIADGLVTDLDKLLELVGGDERLFNQAYRCSFLDANLQYIPSAWADRAIHWKGEIPDLSGADLFAGLDVGRFHDLTVLTVVAVKDGHAWILAILTCPQTAYKGQKRMVLDAFDVLPFDKLYIDRGGIGSGLSEELVDHFGEDVAIPIDFTAGSKELMATRVFRWMRDNRLHYPNCGDLEGKQLRDETVALRRIVSDRTGNVSFDIPRGPKGHGDRFWSMALAMLPAGDPPDARGMGKGPAFAVG